MIRWRKEPPTPAEIRADTTSTELGAGTWHWWYRLPGGRSIVATLAIRMKPGCADTLIVDGELFDPSSWLNVEWAPCLPPDDAPDSPRCNQTALESAQNRDIAQDSDWLRKLVDPIELHRSVHQAAFYELDMGTTWATTRVEAFAQQIARRVANVLASDRSEADRLRARVDELERALERFGDDELHGEAIRTVLSKGNAVTAAAIAPGTVLE